MKKNPAILGWGQRHRVHTDCSPLSSAALHWGSPSVLLLPFLAGTEPSIFILGDEFSEGEPSLALCPERLAADKQSGFTAGLLSPELTLHPERAPCAGQHIPFIIITEKALIILLTMRPVCIVLFKCISVRWNIEKPYFLLSLFNSGGGAAMLRVFSRKIYYSGSCIQGC